MINDNNDSSKQHFLLRVFGISIFLAMSGMFCLTGFFIIVLLSTLSKMEIFILKVLCFVYILQFFLLVLYLLLFQYLSHILGYFYYFQLLF
jgi:hypothetical protein